MNKSILILILVLSTAPEVFAQKAGIYKKGWIDFNKNNKKDVFEDPTQPIEKRVEDLLAQMNLNEKTCQTATLYGFGRVLKDEMPLNSWKNEIWKDVITNSICTHPGCGQRPALGTISRMLR